MDFELEKEGDEVFERNFRSFICWVIDAACGEKAMNDFYTEEQENGKSNEMQYLESDISGASGNINFEPGPANQEETAPEEERVSFFQNVRDAEYTKLVGAFERERIRNEEKEKLAIQKQQEELAKQWDYFFDIGTTDHVMWDSSPKKNVEKQKRTKNEMNTATLDKKLGKPYAPSLYQEPSTSTDERFSKRSLTVFNQKDNLKTVLPLLHPQDNLKTISPLPHEQDSLRTISPLPYQQDNLRSISPLLFNLKGYATDESENRSFSNTLAFKKTENALQTEKTQSEVVVKKKSLRYLAEEIFKRGKSLTVGKTSRHRDLPKPAETHQNQKSMTLEQKGLVKIAATSDDEWETLDLDEIDEPSRPCLKPFFAGKEMPPMPLGSPIPVPVENSNPINLNPFRRIQRWFRKHFACCCCATVVNN